MRWNMSALCNLSLLASRERRQHGCTWLLMFNSFYTFFDEKICLKCPENIVIFVAKKVVQGIKWNASHIMQIKDDYTKSRTFLFLWLARSGSQSKHSQSKHKFCGFSHIYIYIYQLDKIEKHEKRIQKHRILDGYDRMEEVKIDLKNLRWQSFQDGETIM